MSALLYLPCILVLFCFFSVAAFTILVDAPRNNCSIEVQAMVAMFIVFGMSLGKSFVMLIVVMSLSL